MKVLQICAMWANGGVESIIASNIIEWSKRDVQMDILCYVKKESVYDSIIEEHNILIHTPKRMRTNGVLEWIDKVCCIVDVVKKSAYDVIHYNCGRGLDLVFLPIIRIVSPKSKIIVHSHATDEERPHLMIKRTVHYIFKYLFSLFYHKGIGCSELALNWLFPKRYIKNNKAMVIYAGTQINRFRFIDKSREEVRCRYGIADNEFVIGHIGRMCYQKNSTFVIEIFSELKKICDNARMIYIGTGVDENKIKELVKNHKLEKDIVFVNKTDDVPSYLYAMDCFLLPSRFEGLPLVLWEAQVSGLPCVTSLCITKESKITDYFLMEDIDSGAIVWAKKILSLKELNIDRRSIADKFDNTDWDSKVGAKKVYNVYCQLIGENVYEYDN